MTKANLFFDLDGTLSDPREGITKSIVHALQQLGRVPPDESKLNWCIGPPLNQSFAKLLGGNEFVHQAVVHYREHYVEYGMFENKLYEGIRAELSALQELGYSMFVVTSKYDRIAEEVIKFFELNQYFKNIYGSQADGSRGDKTELIRFVLHEQSLSPNTCVMIGDREHDMIGAKNNQVSAIGAGWGYGSHSELIASGAKFVLASPSDLRNFSSGNL